MELGFIMPLAVFGGVVLATLALYSLLVQEPHVVRRRIERYEARAAEVTVSREAPTLLRDRRFSGIRWLDHLLHKTNFAERMALDVARAGVPLRVAEYILLRWLCGMVLAMLVTLMGQIWVMAPVAGVVGFCLPKFYLNFKRQGRVKKFTNQLMDAIILVANSLKSGYSFSQGIELVTKEMPAPISEEFHQVLVEMNLGGSAEEALNNLTKRVPTYDLDLVTTALIIQRQVGGNLAEVLENIAHTIRERIRIMGEVHARTSQARFSGYVIGLMPFGLMGIISFLNPGYMKEMFSSPIGMLMLGAAFTMELFGFMVMKRMVAIEV